MSVAVPIAIGVALVVSLCGQAVGTWPNYASEQNEKSQKQDESKGKSDKKPPEEGKSGQGNSSKNKAGNPRGRSSAATSKDKRDTGSAGR